MQITVTDTGVGINDSIRERIFEPYFTTKKMAEGTGLGLSVTMGIIKNHNGAIEVESVPGEGSTFSVFLPLSTVEQAKAAHTDITTPMGSQQKILVIDDEPFFLEVVQELLVSLDYSVTAENSSQAALKHIHQQPSAFDLVITDQTMP